MRYLIAFLLGFCLSGLWFGCHTLLRPKLEAVAHGALEPLSPLLSAALPTVPICIAARTHPFHLSALADGRLWLLALAAVLLTCLVKRLLCPSQAASTSGLAARCLEAACMEFPQRAMMQTFLCWYLVHSSAEPVWGIVLCGGVWCLSILVQAVILRQHGLRALLGDLLASFVFSLGIGFVYFRTECLLLPMLAHALERYIVTKLYR